MTEIVKKKKQFSRGITHTATGGNVTFTYGHDTSGLINNLTVSDNLFAPYTDIGGYKTFAPNNLNQYSAAMGQAITYDLNGNMAGNGTNAYVHDAANRLVIATVDATTWTYAYGPLDRRVSKADGTTTTQYLYDDVRAVAEYNGSGTLQRKHVYGPGLDEPIMMIVPGDPNEIVYYYHADHLGSVIGLTNNAGAWMEKYAYTLYGKPAVPSTVGNPYVYNGRRFDTETGLYYYRARYLDSKLRRFTETDPIGYAGGMNLYAYVSNSPVNWFDPEGQEAVSATIGMGTAYIAGGSSAAGASATFAVFGVGIGTYAHTSLAIKDTPLGNGCIGAWVYDALYDDVIINNYSYEEHTKNKQKKNYDKHTGRRSGDPNLDKKRQKRKRGKKWKPRK